MSEEDQEQQVPFTREQPRDFRTHSFRHLPEHFGGRSDRELYHKDWKTHQFAVKMDLCQREAITYFKVMSKRIKEEQPDYFEEKGVPEGRFLMDFVGEVCF